MKIAIDHDGCIGSGECVLAAPEVFDQDDDGIVTLVGSDEVDGHDEAIRSAAHACPARIISLS